MIASAPGTDGSWKVDEFAVADYVEPSAEVRVRFSVMDAVNAEDSSVVEAGIDDFEIERLLCETGPCAQDLDDDGVVGAADLAMLLGSWGPCEGCPADFDTDGVVGAADLAVSGAWR